MPEIEAAARPYQPVPAIAAQAIAQQFGKATVLIATHDAEHDRHHVVSYPDGQVVFWLVPGLVRHNEELRAEVARLKADCAALMAVLDPLLVEVEPFRYAQTQEIERQVEAKQEWAKHHNATCGNSNEMWSYSTEFRRSLEASLEPLLKAIREANEVYDRIEAETRKATNPEAESRVDA